MASQNGIIAAGPSELSQAIAALEQRWAEIQKRQKTRDFRSALCAIPAFIGSLIIFFIRAHPLWEQYLVLGVSSGPSAAFALVTSIRILKGPNPELMVLARNLASFDDPAIIWPLLSTLDSLDHPTFWVVGEALGRVLGRAGEWKRSVWTVEERKALEEAVKWLDGGSYRPDPELAETVRRALALELPSARPVPALTGARAIPRWRSAPRS